jgi:hypothetical protein
MADHSLRGGNGKLRNIGAADGLVDGHQAAIGCHDIKGRPKALQTVYDWVTVAIFAGIIVLFLQRSVGPERDSMWHYLVAAVACAVTNQVGNKAVEDSSVLWHGLAIAGLLATLAFIQIFLRPFGKDDH